MNKLTPTPTSFIDTSNELDAVEVELQQKAQQKARAQRERDEQRIARARAQRRRERYIKPQAGETIPTTLDNFPRDLEAQLGRKLEAPGRVMLCAPAGVGKTYTLAGYAIEEYVAKGRRVTFASPTNDTAREAGETLHVHHDAQDSIAALDRFKASQAIRHVEGRNAETCERHKVGARANELSARGWDRLCNKCPLHEFCTFQNAQRHTEHEALISLMTQEKLLRRHPALDAPRRLDAIDWKGIASRTTAGGKFIPWVRQTKKAKRLTIKIDPSGEELPELELIEAEGGEDEATSYTLTDGDKARVLEWFASSKGLEESSLAAILAAYQGQTDQWFGGDLLIIDEAMHERLYTTLALTAGDFSRLASALGVSDEVRGRIADLINATSPPELEDVASAIKSARAVAGAAPDNGELIDKAAPLDNEDEALEVMSEALDWRAPDAWKLAIQHEGRGCFIARNKLHLPCWRGLDLEAWRNVIILDATGTARVARAVLGEGSECLEMRIEDAPSPDVWHAPIELSKTNTEGADFKSAINRAGARGLLLFDEEGCLHFMHKRQLDARDELPEEERRAHYLSHLRGTALHFMSSEARGSNEYEDFHRVIAHTYHYNTRAAEAMAYALCVAGGGDWSDPSEREDWRDEAQYQALGAPLIQHMERIRAIRAAHDFECQLIFTGERDPSDLGYDVTAKICPAELSLIATGERHNWLDRTADPVLLRAGIFELGGIWSPTVKITDEAHGKPGRSLSLPTLLSMMTIEGDEGAQNRVRTALQKAPFTFATMVPVIRTGTMVEDVNVTAQNADDPLNDALRRFQRALGGAGMASYEEVAARLGVKLATAHSGGCGAPSTLFCEPDVSIEDIRQRYPGQFKRIVLEGEEWIANSEDALSALVEGFKGSGVEPPTSYEELLSALWQSDACTFESKRALKAAITAAGGMDDLRQELASNVFELVRGEPFEESYRSCDLARCVGAPDVSRSVVASVSPTPEEVEEATWRGMTRAELSRALDVPALCSASSALLEWSLSFIPGEVSALTARDALSAIFHRHISAGLRGINTCWLAVIRGSDFEAVVISLYNLARGEAMELPEAVAALTARERIAWYLASRGGAEGLEENITPAPARRAPPEASRQSAMRWARGLGTAQRLARALHARAVFDDAERENDWEHIAWDEGRVLPFPGFERERERPLYAAWSAARAAGMASSDFGPWWISQSMSVIGASGRQVGTTWNTLFFEMAWRAQRPVSLAHVGWYELPERDKLSFMRWTFLDEARRAGEVAYRVACEGHERGFTHRAAPGQTFAALSHESAPIMGAPLAPGSPWCLTGQGDAPLPLLDAYKAWGEREAGVVMPYALWRFYLAFVLSHEGQGEVVVSLEDTAELAMRDHGLCLFDLPELDQLELVRRHLEALATRHYGEFARCDVEWCVRRSGELEPLFYQPPRLVTLRAARCA